MLIFFRFVRFFSSVTLFFFCWSYLSIWQIAAYAMEDKKLNLTAGEKGAANEAIESPGGGFEKALESIRDNVSRAEEKRLKSQDPASEIAAMKAKKEEIAKFDAELQQEFAAMEKKLTDSNLPREVLDRHIKFVKHYNSNLAELRVNLDAIGKAKTDTEVRAALAKTKIHLEKVKPPKRHTPLDPNKLPHRQVKAKERAPRLKKEDFEKEFGPSTGKGRVGTAQVALDSIVGMQDQLLASWIKSRASARKPLQLAYNGPVGDIPALFGSKSNNDDYTKPLPDFSFFHTASAMNYEQEALLLAQAASNPPAAADLAETIEIQFTPEIRAKAQELGYNPVTIYEWVSNNIEFVPTYGSILGADMCLKTKQCNAFDTSSLLVALLRASNIPARYVYGTAEIPIEKIMNWMGGFTDPLSALGLIASGGTPATGLTVGGTVAKVRMEHIWVEIYAPYGPYSGRPSKIQSANMWLPLDASFKQYAYTKGIDFNTAIPFDGQAFLDQMKAGAVANEQEQYITSVNPLLFDQALTDYQSRLQNYIQDNVPNPTSRKILGSKDIVKQKMGILPVTLSYQVKTVGGRWSAIPDSLRHKLTFEIRDYFDTSLYLDASIPELAGKRVTLAYEPATPYDQQLVNSYGSMYQVPAYLLQVKPVMKIEGATKAAGSPTSLGADHSFDMIFKSPSFGSEIVHNELTAGGHHSIVLDLSSVPTAVPGVERANILKQQIENGTSFYDDGVVGDILHMNGYLYFAQHNLLNFLSNRISGIVTLKHPSEAMISLATSVAYMWGTPRAVKITGLGIDVDRDLYSPVALDGEESKVTQFMITSGMRGSGLENVIFEQNYQLQSISAVKALQLANQQGIPIFTVDQKNINQALPKLAVSSDVKTDIINAVSAGKIVTVPQRNLQLKAWNGVGYIVLDPATGAGAYMISGGSAGGSTWADIGSCITEAVQLFAAIAGITWWVEVLGFIGGVIDAINNPDSNMLFPLILLAAVGLIAGLLFWWAAVPLLVFSLSWWLMSIMGALLSLTILWASNVAATGNPNPITLIDDCLSLVRRLFSSLQKFPMMIKNGYQYS